MASFVIEDQVSGIKDSITGINSLITDFTSVQILTAVNVTSGAGASGTATFLNIGRWAVNNLWIDITSPTINAASTGCEVRMFGRATSGSVWARFITNSNLVSSTYLIPVRGSGTDMSGQAFFGDLKLEVYNISSSGTAVVNAYIMSKRSN